MTTGSPATPGVDVANTDDEHTLPIGTDGEELPAQEIVTGRGFITGKSGAGKSNSVTVLLEELFELGLPALVVDTDGEYHPLKERYDVLHVGGDSDCARIVDETDAERLADLAIGDGVPIVLDASAYAEETAAEVIEAVVRALFANAKRERRPYLLVVEEIQEYLPQRGSTDLSGLLTKIAKRGRKHGLGILGASQRPSSVDKDFITQSNWTVWHRLTYETDTNNAGKNLGSEYTDPISSLDDGEAFVQTDWLETTTTLRFRRKHVSDAGATPSIDAYVETPTAHDTAALLERLGSNATAGVDETAADECDCSEVDVDRQALAYERRAAVQLAERVRELTDELQATRDELNGVRGSLGRQNKRVDELRELLEVQTGKVERKEGATFDKNDHMRTTEEIVGENFGISMGELYEEYSERMSRPNSDRSVRNYLQTLRDAGRVAFVGSKRGRRYYPIPAGLELPEHTTPAETIVTIRDADTLRDVQQELRTSRKVAKQVVGKFTDTGLETADGRSLRAAEFEYNEETNA